MRTKREMKEYVAEELTETSLVYPTVMDRRGLISTPPKMVQAAEEAAKCIGRQICGWEGDKDYTRAMFDIPIAEEEADMLLEKLMDEDHLI